MYQFNNIPIYQLNVQMTNVRIRELLARRPDSYRYYRRRETRKFKDENWPPQNWRMHRGSPTADWRLETGD